MSYLLLPADARLKRLAVQIEEERRGENRGFEALSSTAAQLDEAILTQTTMQLFASEDAPAPAARPAAPRVPGEIAHAVGERLRTERARPPGRSSSAATSCCAANYGNKGGLFEVDRAMRG